MTRLKKWLTKTKPLLVLATVALILSLAWAVLPTPNVPSAVQTILTVGFQDTALGITYDYTVDGDNDDVEVTQALADLPDTGGEVKLYAGVYDFHATIDWNEDDITISGVGKGASIVTVGISAPFTVTGQTGWRFTNFACDQTPLYDQTLGVSDDAIVDIWIAGVYTIDAPTGTFPSGGGGGPRVDTIVVAAADATVDERSAADYTCDGTDDHVQISAAITAAAGGTVQLVGHEFSCESFTVGAAYLKGQGSSFEALQGDDDVGTTIHLEQQGSGITVVEEGYVWDLNICSNDSGQTVGTAALTVQPVNSIDMESLILNNIVVADMHGNVGNQTGIGILIQASGTGSKYIELSNFGPMTAFGYDVGVQISTTGTMAFINGNVFQYIGAHMCVTGLYLVSTCNGGDYSAIDGNIFQSIQINASTGAWTTPTDYCIRINGWTDTLGYVASNQFHYVVYDLPAACYIGYLEDGYRNCFFGWLTYPGSQSFYDDCTYTKFYNTADETASPEISVGTGGDYSTISAALAANSGTAANRKLIVLVSDVEEVTSVTLENYVDIWGNGHKVTRTDASINGTIRGAGAITDCYLWDLIVSRTGSTGSTGAALILDGTCTTGLQFRDVLFTDNSSAADVETAYISGANAATFEYCSFKRTVSATNSYALLLTTTGAPVFNYCTFESIRTAVAVQSATVNWQMNNCVLTTTTPGTYYSIAASGGGANIGNQALRGCVFNGPSSGITTWYEVTLSGDAATLLAGCCYYTVDTQADAATDNMATINGGYCGQVIYVHPNNDARTTVIQHNVGNIWCRSGADITLDDLQDMAMLVFDGTKWMAL